MSSDPSFGFEVRAQGYRLRCPAILVLGLRFELRVAGEAVQRS